MIWKIYPSIYSNRLKFLHCFVSHLFIYKLINFISLTISLHIILFCYKTKLLFKFKSIVGFTPVNCLWLFFFCFWSMIRIMVVKKPHFLISCWKSANNISISFALSTTTSSNQSLFKLCKHKQMINIFIEIGNLNIVVRSLRSSKSVNWLILLAKKKID